MKVEWFSRRMIRAVDNRLLRGAEENENEELKENVAETEISDIILNF